MLGSRLSSDPTRPLPVSSVRARPVCVSLSLSLPRSLAEPLPTPPLLHDFRFVSNCRRQPLSSPLMYRTAWHVPLFPNDLVLKICLHEDDRSNVRPTLTALDSRGCYLLVLPRGKGLAGAGGSSRGPTTTAPPSAKKQQRTGGFTLPTPPVLAPNANGISGRRSGSFESPLPPASASSAATAAAAVASGRPSALPVATRPVSSRLSAPSPAAARARAAAAAAVIANAKAVAAVAAAKEAQAVAAAAAAEEAVMVAKAVEAGVAVPWTWRESEVSSRGTPKDRRWAATPSASASPLQVAAAANGRLVPEAAARRASSSAMEAMPPVAGGLGGEKEEGGVEVYVWKGARSNGECARTICHGMVVTAYLQFLDFTVVSVQRR